ncbi:hydroxymethylglutaryl-CoA reductase [Sunxiuqinia indica]|uniref:hydroxymethylglutaryl-CoA reductase n=1 Tax=Sunxiuqinia indica TaxID=2692584 RepID=UPI001F405218|nr:hydroxymethylglutaryl-CoA reductase [Sunxiuqinia indica]
MMDRKIVNGFSKLDRKQKIQWLVDQYNLDEATIEFLDSFQLDDEKTQEIIADLSENQLSNYHLPFTVAPNFLVDGKLKTFPLVTEESSVVAALAKAAGYWAKRGGFHTQIIGTEKKGQVHFLWKGDHEKLNKFFPEIKQKLFVESAPLTEKMTNRGGGISAVKLKYLPEVLPNYYQLDVSFETCDAMGANFINSCLEQFGKTLKNWVVENDQFAEGEKELEIIMAILSNYVPGSSVRVWVEYPVDQLDADAEKAQLFASKFVQAVHISRNDVSRAVTHNKGIFNGIDALAIATGNDFRAIEAGGHAYAAKDGKYRGLSDAGITDGNFWFSLELPLAVGVVGGVTRLHPLAKLAMQILEQPSAKQLMTYLAISGLASNWSAVRALVTTGIQQGHMKMHLSNILNTLQVSDEQKQAARLYFESREVSFSDVQNFLNTHAG